MRFGGHMLIGLCCAAALAPGVPRGLAAARILFDESRPDRAAAAAIWAAPEAMNAAKLKDGAQAALAAGDADLAASFASLARAQRAPLPDALLAQIAQARAQEASAGARLGRFAEGFVTGRSDDGARLVGTLAGDLTLFGDIRDLAREGWHAARGREVDRTMVALAGAGLAASAATYLSVGAAGVARVGVSVVKGLRRGARSGLDSGHWLVGLVRRAGRSGAGLEALGATARAGARIEARLGPRGAFDALKIARAPKDVARVARLAEARGPQTRALLKIFGRGAIALGTLASQLFGWMLWLAMALVGALAWVKGATERTTRMWLRRRKLHLALARAGG